MEIASKIKPIMYRPRFQVESNSTLEICITILLVSTDVGVNRLFGSCAVLPITITTAIVSPIARVIPRMTA
ncbi:hypothetical protein D3C75_1310430 [compost metagenome]